MSAKHKLGNWKVSEAGYMSPMSIMTKDGSEQICSSICSRANANLIASAPDLLEACKMAKRVVKNLANSENTEIFKELERVINIAEGR